MDFQETLTLVKAGDFVYLDPPYRVSSVRTFKEYMPAGFGPSDLMRLREYIDVLARRRIGFVLSYAESAEAKLLAKGFHKYIVSVRRHIAGENAARAPAREVIITNLASK
jgi:DNA adenine methylase